MQPLCYLDRGLNGLPRRVATRNDTSSVTMRHLIPKDKVFREDDDMK